MANTKYVLEKIKVSGELEDLIAKSNGENVTVDYNGTKTLSAALAEILTSIGGAMTEDEVQQKISAAIDDLIGGAPATYDTLKEIADYIEQDEEGAAAMTQAIAGKVSTETFNAFKGTISALGALAGKDKVAESDLDEDLAGKIGDGHTHSNKAELDKITEGKVAEWDAKADATKASASADGLMAKEDKARLDAIGGVFYGTGDAPTTMKDGDLFVHVIEG